MTNYNHPQHFLPTFADMEDGVINCLVEIQRGSINKYEIQKDTGFFKLDRVLFQQTPYPFDYGLISQTYDADDDLLDVAVLNDGEPFAQACLVEGRVIGVMYFDDTGETDDKIIVVPNDDYRWKEVKDISDLSKAQIEEMEFFWTHIKDIQFKYKNKPNAKTTVKGWGGRDEAMKVIQHAQEVYKAKYQDNPNLS